MGWAPGCCLSAGRCWIIPHLLDHQESLFGLNQPPRPIRVNKIKTNAFDTSKLFDQGRVKKIGVKINEIKVINERCVADLLPPYIAIVNLITFLKNYKSTLTQCLNITFPSLLEQNIYHTSKCKNKSFRSLQIPK